MRRVLRILALALPIVLVVSNSYGAVKAGTVCSKVGSKSNSGGKTFTCVKSGKKLVWDKGVLLPAAQPSPSASASPSPSPTAVAVADPVISAKSIFADPSICELKSSVSHEANLGYGIDSTYLNSVGTVNFAIIFTTYTDAPGDDRAFNEYTKVQFPNMANFYSTASYGRLNIKLVSTEKYYNINKSSASYNLMAMNQTSHFWEVVTDAMDAAKNDYDFSKIDGVLVVMPSTAKAVDLGATGLQYNAGGKTFYQGITAAYINPSNKEAVKPLFLTHEIGHNFGLPHPLPQDRGYAWDVMLWEQNPAPDLFGWEKFILKWIDPKQVDCLSDIPAAPIVDYLEATEIGSSSTKIVTIKLSDAKLLVVESRRKSTIDDLLPNEEGALVYTVDVNLRSNQGPIKPITTGAPMHKSGSNQMLVGTLQQGKSISTEGVTISVLKSDAKGDFISISKN